MNLESKPKLYVNYCITGAFQDFSVEAPLWSAVKYEEVEYTIPQGYKLENVQGIWYISDGKVMSEFDGFRRAGRYAQKMINGKLCNILVRWPEK